MQPIRQVLPSLKPAETITENQSNRTAELWRSAPADTAATSSHTQPAQGSLLKRGQKDSKSQKNREFSLKLCLLGMSEGRHTHQVPQT